MPHWIEKRPTPSFVISIIALAVSMTGAGFAATQHSASPLALAKKKTKHKKALIRRGPRGHPGPRGPKGERGATGVPDTSAFYGKAESDGRYLPIAGTARDSGQLGGIPANGFVRGNASVVSKTASLSNSTDTLALPGVGSLQLICGGDTPTGRAGFMIHNASGESLMVGGERHGGNTLYGQENVADGADSNLFNSAAYSDRFTIQAIGQAHAVTVIAMTRDVTSSGGAVGNCGFWVHAISQGG